MKRLLIPGIALVMYYGLSVSPASAQPLLEKLEKKLDIFIPPQATDPSDIPMPSGEILPSSPPPAGSFPDQRPTLGISVNSVTAEARRRYGLTVRRGALIQAIVPGSPADKYGLPLGGVIVGVDSARIDSPDDLVAVIAKAKVGDSIEIAYYQREKLYNKTVRLAPMVLEPYALRRPSEPSLRLVPRLVPPGTTDRPFLRQLEGVLGRVITPPLHEPIADNRADIQALRRQVQELQEQLELTLIRVSELEERVNPKKKKKDEKK